MSWSNDNRAHRETNTALVALKQYRAVSFREVGDKKIKTLAFFPGPDMPQSVEKQAGLNRASMLDGVMNQWATGVRYEKNYGSARTVKALARVLADGDKTIADLADVVDACYEFAEEGPDA